MENIEILKLLNVICHQCYVHDDCSLICQHYLSRIQSIEQITQLCMIIYNFVQVLILFIFFVFVFIYVLFIHNLQAITNVILYKLIRCLVYGKH